MIDSETPTSRLVESRSAQPTSPDHQTPSASTRRSGSMLSPPDARLRPDPTSQPLGELPEPERSRRRSRRRLAGTSAAAGVVAVALVAGLGAASTLSSALESSAAKRAGELTAPVDDLEQATEPRSLTVDPSTAGVAQPPDVAVEPVAVVAERLGPSVVQVETNGGQGSGVVFREGLIMTNNHVVAGTSSIQVRLADGRVAAAELVGTDARIDIAVLRVDIDDLPVAELALDGSLGVGHLVVAIGSPFQLQQTVTSGVVSAINRPVPNGVAGANAMIQTDTAINPGNSGGALADRAGRVVGINTSGRTDGNSNSNIGIGFAVPIDTAVATADRLLAGASMQPGVLGISPSTADSAELGVLIDTVEPGSAAEDGGLAEGDRILTVDGVAVPSPDALAAIVQNHFGGDVLEIGVERAGVESIVEVVLG